MWYITLLLATLVLADYYIDNANMSITYVMPPTEGGQGWQTFVVGGPQLVLNITNSTGNYAIVLDPSNCYDEDYALGVCTTDQNCFIQVPFVGSGITMYVFNAGGTGMTASFSVDGGKAVSNSIDAPPGPNFQVSNVSLYDIQGLPSGNHTMVMTLLDWNGGGTSMKFDYARINETFVAPPVTTTSASAFQTSASSQTPTPTPVNNSTTPKKANVGSIVGGTLGGSGLLVGLVACFFCLRKRNRNRKDEFPPTSNFQVSPFTSGVNNPTPPSVPHPHHEQFYSQHPERTDAVMRSAILREALAAGNYSSRLTDQSSQSISSGSRALQPLRRQPSYDADVDGYVRSSVSHVANPSVTLSDAPYNLSAEQIELIDRLRADNVPQETIMRVIDGFVSPKLSTGEIRSDSRLARPGSFASAVPPPSYQTRDG